ncbi:MAG: hypothetical protein RR588_03425 [Solibacillus sp.]
MKESTKLYARDCIKCYVRNQQSQALNYKAAANIMKMLPQTDVDIISDVFLRLDTVEDNVYQVASEHNINQDTIWALLNKVTKLVAKERGLI